MTLQKLFFSCGRAIALACLALQMHAAAASIVITGTRVIYKATDAETTVKLNNSGVMPVLAQIWLDTGDSNASPDTLDVPFTITPAVARIDPGKAQTLRIAYTGEPMPVDRESVLWLNVLEIPPKPGAVNASEATGSTLQLAFRTRIKFFFRPARLPGTAADAPATLRWAAAANKQISVSNPSAFNVSLGALHVTAGAQKSVYLRGGMIEPGGALTLPLTGDAPLQAGAEIQFETINDFGGITQHSAKLAN